MKTPLFDKQQKKVEIDQGETRTERDHENHRPARGSLIELSRPMNLRFLCSNNNWSIVSRVSRFVTKIEVDY